jgi:hypothetical protein
MAAGERDGASRWVLPSAEHLYPRLLDAGVVLRRCVDLTLTEGLLLGHDGRWGESRSLGAAWARLAGLPVPEDPSPPTRQAQQSLFGADSSELPGGAAAIDAAIAVDPLGPFLWFYREMCLYQAGRYRDLLIEHQRATRLKLTFVYLDSSAMELVLYPTEFKEMLRRWLETYPEKITFGTDAFPFGETLGVELATITHEVHHGKGRLAIDDVVQSEMHPYAGPDGSTTTLHDSLFSTVPGSPAYVAVADTHDVRLPQYGMQWSLEGRNAIQADYRIQHAP